MPGKNPVIATLSAEAFKYLGLKVPYKYFLVFKENL